MARCRIGYLLTLLGAGAFFLSFHGYFSFYVLILALVFPLFSLAVSLPGMLGTRVSFAVSQRAIRRGGSVRLSLTAENRFKLPLGRLSGRIRCTNLMTGRSVSFRRKAAGGSLGLFLTADVDEHHCGLLRCEVTALKVCDLLGLFALRLLPPERIDLLSLPLDLPPEEHPALLGEGERQLILKPRPGGGPGEDYELRPYRAGDPMRSVHWKLSTKLDELVVREMLEPVQIQVVLTYDHFGAPEDLDRVMDRLDAISRALIERERPHAIRWADPLTGAARSAVVSSLNDLRAFEYAAFAIPAPQSGLSILAQPIRTEGAAALRRHLHISAEERGGGET